jgi:cobalt-precorrin-5B (C1)-methyltransferase
MSTGPEQARQERAPGRLRTGFTTGTCAAAAAKAAAILMKEGKLPEKVDVLLPSGVRVELAVSPPPPGVPEPAATVVKDAGDDPDCTHGAHVTASLALARSLEANVLRAGEGVGIVTRPGLGIEPGEPSITRVPRRMINAALADVLDHPVVVTFYVPGGEEMARQTTNDRLGIVGGISILGTTGIVRPFSTAAYRASVLQQIDVAAALGQRHLVLAVGSRTDALAHRVFGGLDPVCYVEVGDFMGPALKNCSRRGIGEVDVVAMAGKMTKYAQGVFSTHFHHSSVDVQLLARLAQAAGAPPQLVEAATLTATARHFTESCIACGCLAPLEALVRLAQERLAEFCGGRVRVRVHLADFDGERILVSA